MVFRCLLECSRAFCSAIACVVDLRVFACVALLAKFYTLLVGETRPKGASALPGGLLLLSGFKRCDMEAVRSVFGDHFEVPSAPTIERDGYVALACRRTATALSTSALSESAVQ